MPKGHANIAVNHSDSGDRITITISLPLSEARTALRIAEQFAPLVTVSLQETWTAPASPKPSEASVIERGSSPSARGRPGG